MSYKGVNIASSSLQSNRYTTKMQNKNRTQDDSSLPQADLSIMSEYFDREYYLQQLDSADTANSLEEVELINHYHADGVQLGFDPVRWFSTKYYLDSNLDVAALGVNPFLHFLRHGVNEGRHSLPGSAITSLEALADMSDEEIDSARNTDKFTNTVDATNDLAVEGKSEFRLFLDKCLEDSLGSEKDGLPIVSAIVPNFNHQKYLRERLDSILNQSFQSVEIIILDDCSTDESVKIIDEYTERYPEKIVSIKNTRNSGNVFKQWKKGIDHCKGKYIWICESDDSAEIDFLEQTLPAFNDLAVMIAFCRIQFIDSDGNELEGLDAYRNRAEADIWESDRSGPAAAWFSGAFSVHNIIPNVGGCIIRRQHIEDSVWEAAQQFNILGDWFLYLNLSRGGKIAYVSSATTYFRQHGRNTSVESFNGSKYYREHNELAQSVKKIWDVTPDTTWRFYKQIESQYSSIHSGTNDTLFDLFSLDSILATKRKKMHVLIGFLGFHVGGGEYFPIYLANALVKNNINVSLLALDVSHINADMYELVDSRIPVYSANDVRALGAKEFLKQTGASLINSHHIGVEGLLFLENESDLDIPYVATLHGTYEVSGVGEYYLSKIVRNVDRWIYTADKNVTHLNNRHWCKTARTKLHNATPVSNELFHLSRKLLNISEDSFIFVLVSRPVKEKGWEDAIQSFLELRKENVGITLLLVGESEYQEELEREYQAQEGIYFLGYQSNMHGLLKMCDCCLLPTRFPGESYPLILIQALQNSLPCVSTDIGEIPNMLIKDEKCAGVLIDHKDAAYFQDNLTSAMQSMLSKEIYDTAKSVALDIGSFFSMGNLAIEYLSIFNSLLKIEEYDDSASVLIEENDASALELTQQ